MRTATILILISVVGLSMGSTGLAAQKKAQLHHLSGEVVSADAAAKALTVKETLKDGKTKDIAFTVDDTTKVTIQGKAGKLEDLKAGDPVKVSYHKTGTEHHAVAIALMSSPAKKP